MGRQLLRLGYLSKHGLNAETSADSTFRTFFPSMLTVDCLLLQSHHLLHTSQRTKSASMVPWGVRSPLDYLSLHLFTILILLPNGIWLERSHRKRWPMSHESVSRRAGLFVRMVHGSMFSAYKSVQY